MLYKFKAKILTVDLHTTLHTMHNHLKTVSSGSLHGSSWAKTQKLRYGQADCPGIFELRSLFAPLLLSHSFSLMVVYDHVTTCKLFTAAFKCTSSIFHLPAHNQVILIIVAQLLILGMFSKHPNPSNNVIVKNWCILGIAHIHERIKSTNSYIHQNTVLLFSIL